MKFFLNITWNIAFTLGVLMIPKSVKCKNFNSEVSNTREGSMAINRHRYASEFLFSVMNFKKCLNCNGDFKPKDKTKIYCSHVCYSVHKRAKFVALKEIKIEGEIAFIELTHGRTASIDRADLPLVEKYNWRTHNTAFNKHNYYAVTDINGVVVFIHRLILGITDRKITVDHINGDGLNNRRDNLRVCSSAENARNQKVNANSKSGLKGVCLHSDEKKWVATIGFNSKHIYIGRFATKEEAAHAYDARAKELYGEFARLNYPVL